jgi:predicted DNA-binding protein
LALYLRVYTGMNAITENKHTISIRLHKAMIARLHAASTKTGLKITTILEQGAEKRLHEIEM